MIKVFERAKKQMRFTDADLAKIKGLFAEDDEAIMVLRKIFMPELTPDAPLGQQIDLWLAMDIDSMSPEQAVLAVKARNMMIRHVEQCILNLINLAGDKDETIEQANERLRQNSSK